MLKIFQGPADIAEYVSTILIAKIQSKPDVVLGIHRCQTRSITLSASVAQLAAVTPVLIE